MKQLLALAFTFVCIGAIGQGEANNWHFGIGASITFNSGSPVATPGSSMIAEEGCSAASDAQGNLLFYTNGQTVWDASHNVMANGTGLLGWQTATNSGLVVRKPGSTDIFYVFSLSMPTIGGFTWANYHLYCSEVDMSLNGGLGAVTFKNFFLDSGLTEKVTAVRHANGTDIWVSSHKSQFNDFSTFLITTTGIQTQPVVSSVGPNMGSSDFAGAMKFSPDGTKLAMARFGSDVWDLFNFDASTGVITSFIATINSPVNIAYGVEFSPDCTKLYGTSSSTGIYQWDITSGNPVTINNSMVQVGTGSGTITLLLHALQLGPDNKIYCTRANQGHIGQINQPNLAGTACNYIDQAVLINATARRGLPNYVQSLFFNPFNFNGICFGDTTFFTTGNISGLDSLLWDFGDTASGSANTSMLLSPTHIFSDTGVFQVNVITYVGTTIDTFLITVTIIDSPQLFSLGPDTLVCFPDSVPLGVMNNPAMDYLWQDNSTASTLTAYTTGTYWLQISNSCGSFASAIDVTVAPLPALDLGPDTGLCSQDSVLLQSNISNASYTWSSGAASSALTVGATGNYWLQVTDSNLCSASDTIFVEYYQVDTLDLGNDTLICFGDTLQISSNVNGLTFLWSNNTVGTSINAFTTGQYWLEVVDSNQCMVSDSIDLVVAALPVVDLGPDTTICNGSSYLFNGPVGMSSYLWFSGHTTTDLFVTISDTVWLTVIDSNGCTSSDTAMTEVVPLPIFSLGNDTTFCEGDSVQLVFPLNDPAYVWSNGASTQTIFVSQQGDYSVTATDSNNCTFADTVQIQVAPLPIVYLGSDTLLCPGESYTLDVANPGAQYLWSDGNTSPFRQVWQAENLWVIVTSPFGCISSDSLEVSTVSLDLGPDLEFCEDDSHTLIVPDSLQSVHWFEHGSGQSLTVIETDVYRVSAAYEHCVLLDSVEVAFIAFPAPPELRDTTMCLEDFPEGLSVEVPDTYTSLLWSTGETAPEIQVINPGVYTLTLTNSDSCSISDTFELVDFCDPSIFFPNSFTPNGDGINDVFRPLGTNVVEYELLIFNRWGELIFSTNDFHQGWDGQHNGKSAQQDTYVWRAKYRMLNSRGGQPDFETHGRVTLLRPKNN